MKFVTKLDLALTPCHFDYNPCISWDWATVDHWILPNDCFTRQTSLASYNPHEFLYGREHIFLNSIWRMLDHIVDPDGPNVRAQYLQERAQFFQKAMPMTMENFFMAQHPD